MSWVMEKSEKNIFTTKPTGPGGSEKKSLSEKRTTKLRNMHCYPEAAVFFWIMIMNNFCWLKKQLQCIKTSWLPITGSLLPVQVLLGYHKGHQIMCVNGRAVTHPSKRGPLHTQSPDCRITSLKPTRTCGI